jgi:hypothetical protein
MIHIQYIIFNKDKVVFWIKPLWCPIGSPFCIVRWNTKQGMNICPLYYGAKRKTDGGMCIECTYDNVSKSNSATQSYLVPPYSLLNKYDEVSILNATTEAPENCLGCMHYLGFICMTYGEFRDPCDNFMDEERFVTETAKRLREDC